MLALLLEDAANADARKSDGLEFIGRSNGFTKLGRTGTAALNPTRPQCAPPSDVPLRYPRAEDDLAEVGW